VGLVSEDPRVGPPKEPPDRRPWYRPTSLIGAYTKAKYESDAHVRELVKVLIQGGAVGIALVALFLVYVSQTKIAEALDRFGTKNDRMAIALENHLDEDVKNELAERVAEKLMAKDKDFEKTKDGRLVPKPVKVPLAPARRR